MNFLFDTHNSANRNRPANVSPRATAYGWMWQIECASIVAYIDVVLFEASSLCSLLRNSMSSSFRSYQWRHYLRIFMVSSFNPDREAHR